MAVFVRGRTALNVGLPFDRHVGAFPSSEDVFMPLIEGPADQIEGSDRGYIERRYQVHCVEPGHAGDYVLDRRVTSRMQGFDVIYFPEALRQPGELNLIAQPLLKNELDTLADGLARPPQHSCMKELRSQRIATIWSEQ